MCVWCFIVRAQRTLTRAAFVYMYICRGSRIMQGRLSCRLASLFGQHGHHFCASAFMPPCTQFLAPSAFASSSSSVRPSLSKAVCGFGTWRPLSKPGRRSSVLSHLSRWGNSSSETPAQAWSRRLAVSEACTCRGGGKKPYCAKRPIPSMKCRRR